MRSLTQKLSMVCLLGLSVALCAWAEEAVQFDIASQPMSTALKRFAEQAGMQLLYRHDAVDGATANAVKGTFDKRNALEQLLRGTGLEAIYSADNAATIRAGAGGAAATKKATEVEPDSIHLTQVLRAAGTAAAESRVDEEEKKKTAEESKGIPEMLVKGSHVLNADIERTEDAPQPYVVFDRAEIQRSQASTLNDFLKTRLPMNAIQTNINQVAAFGQNNSGIDLRGLGQNQTLVVVDGRRMPGLFDTMQFGQPDINGIPLSAVERIEVLPSTAGGIYGGGATGGVVNIITRKDYSGMEIDAGYGNTLDTDAATRRIELSGGFALQDGRTRIRLAASRSDSNPLLAGDRDFVRRGRALLLHNNPNAIYGSLNSPGYTTNIRSSNGSNLQLKNTYGGTPLNSPITYVPVGYGGISTDNAQALVRNAGKFNLDLPDDLAGLRQSLLVNPAIQSAAFNLRHEFGERVEAFIDASWYDNGAHSHTGFITGTATLPLSSPLNPFTTAIRVRFPENSIHGERHTSAETLRNVGGLIVRLPREWSAEADYAWSRARGESSPRDPVVGDPDGAGPGRSVDSALQTGPLNVLRDLNLYPLDYTPYLLPRNAGSAGPFDTILKDATLRLSGPLMKLPGGALMLTSLLEHRNETAQDSFADYLLSNASTGTTFYPSRSQTVDSLYLEARAPVLRGLELQASVRRDDYETSAPSPTSVDFRTRDDARPPLVYSTNRVRATKFTLGLLYSPLEDISLRASYGTGFLPPSIAQIVQEPPFEDGGTFIVDPKRENAPVFVAPVAFIFGGNPDLRPEESKSWSAGVILTPRALPGLRVSIDYTQVTKTDEIASLLDQQLVDLEDYLPGRVVRGELSAEDIDNGLTVGPVILLDESLVNVSRMKMKAYDIQADYVRSLAGGGELHFYTLATWQPHFERQVVPVLPFVDSAGYNNGTLQWRGNGGLIWDRGAWSLGWNGQFYDSYFVYTADAPPATASTARLNQGSRKIPRQFYHDVFARYRMGPTQMRGLGLLSNAELMFGIQNVFDRSPPILATAAANGGYSTYGDPRMRRYSLSLRVNF